MALTDSNEALRALVEPWSFCESAVRETRERSVQVECPGMLRVPLLEQHASS